MPGTKPKLAEFKLMEGNPGHRKVNRPDVDENGVRLALVVDDNGLRPMRKLGERQMELWESFIQTAPWLGKHDIPRSEMWVELHTEWETSPKKMSASRLIQLRGLGSELGFDPVSRSRMGAMAVGKKSKFDGLISERGNVQ